MPHQIAPGAHIELRDAVWRVERVDLTSTGTQAWRCVGVSEIVRDQQAVFLEEYEPRVRVLDPRETHLVRDTSSQHRAGLLYIESLLRDLPPPDDGLYVGHKAAMDLLEFQLQPAWLALSRPRQRILIADGVGLGKTLEAGILLAELIRRGRGRRILVATTKAMLIQFQKEMWGRFTIPLVRLDSIGLARIRAEIPSHHNPFYYYDKTIMSIDTLKQNSWFRTHVENAHWDVVVIDEAHNVASRGSKDSQRANIAQTLSANCDSLILLSATPHDGRPESFASLMNMLDPTAIANPSDYTKDEIQGLYVRRFRRDVKEQLARYSCEDPEVEELHATASAEEEEAFEQLVGLQLPVLDEGAKGGILFKTGLTKALFSSPSACLEQLRSPLRRKRVAEAIPDTVLRQLRDKEMTTTSEALDSAAAYWRGEPMEADLLALSDLARAIEAITPERFSKYMKLLETIDEIGWTLRRAKTDRLVIFTERRQTLSFLAEHLGRDLGLADGQLAILHGGLSDVAQNEIVEGFGKEKAKTRVLLATDVASEGLNLHYLCHRLIHFDMPWSLMVFQQRNGRVDRYGQTERPQIVYLQTDSENDEIKGDTRILTVLRKKAEQAHLNLGDASALLGLYDEREEEAYTAKTIQNKVAPEELERDLDGKLIDPFELVLERAAADTAQRAPVREHPTLYDSDFDFFAEGIARLKETSELHARVYDQEKLIELKWPGDLERRFKKLPREIRPDDGVVLLTADPGRMQRALEDARREENAWPRHQLLWANSPILDWLTDRIRGEFGRHTAPVLVVPQLGGADITAVIVSGLLPNRRGQPLVHRWYVARFEGNVPLGVDDFESFIEACELGRQPLPNAGEEIDQERLSRLLPPAIEAVERRVITDRDSFRAQIGPKLNSQRERLTRLEVRQLEYLAKKYAGKTDARSLHLRSTQERHVRKLFQDYQHWIEDAMTIADKPFLQVVAVLVGGVR
jgi:ERCC4-related helicase